MGANRWRPFVDGGVSFRSLERTGAPGPSRHGLTGGAGVAIEFGRIQLTPQLRYTRWAQGESNGYYDVKRDQLELVTGISYRMPTAVRGNQRMAAGILGGARLNETLAGYPIDWTNGHSAAYRLMNVRADSRSKPTASKPIGTTKFRTDVGVPADEIPLGRSSAIVWRSWTVVAASGNLQSSIPPSRYGFTAGEVSKSRLSALESLQPYGTPRWSGGKGMADLGSTLYNPNSVELIVGVSF